MLLLARESLENGRFRFDQSYAQTGMMRGCLPMESVISGEPCTMVDVLLIQPPIKDFYLTAKRTIPYGLACIAASLIRAGFSVRMLDCLATSRSRAIPLPQEMFYLNKYYATADISPFALFHQYKYFGYSFQYIEQEAKKSKALVVGISSLFTAYSQEALDVAKIIRQALPQSKIVLGGHHPTVMPEAVLQHAEIDYIIRGEGEVAMVELVKALTGGKSLASIPGLVFRQADGTFDSSSPAVVDILDSLPLPATHLIKHDFYRRKSQGSAVICTSRGCPLKCSYCSLGNSSYIPYRRRSVESVLREIELAVSNFDASFVDFEDENISMEKGWFLELLDGIKGLFSGHNLELRAMNGLLPLTLDDEVIREMAAAGFKTLNLSLGTTSPRQLKRFSRPDVTAAFDEALASAEKYGLQAVGYIIVGAPEQDPHDSLQDLLFLAERRVLAGVSVFYPSPGSLDFKKCERMGILPQSFGLMRATALPVSHKTSGDDSSTLLRLGRLLNFMKSLLDAGIDLPQPSPISSSRLQPMKDKVEMGKTLLQGFFQDGVIRGITPDGNVFEHQTSRTLCEDFRNSCLAIKVRGTC